MPPRIMDERWLLAFVLTVLAIGSLVAIRNSPNFRLILTREKDANSGKDSEQFQNSPTLNNSEIVHIGQICHNWLSIRRLTTFVKSMLFYRSCPIVLHILTNLETSVVIKDLFRTWNLPHLEVKVYVRDDEEREMRWVHFLHRAGPFALKKLMLEKILPPDLDRIIFYDADVLLIADVLELWELFEGWNSTQVVGLAPETQSWYGSRQKKITKKIWPSIDWGYNTGLILYDLKKMRNMDWPGLWKPVARQELAIRGYALLPEQDVLNACFVKHPEILRKVPCVWNMQFGDRINMDSCPHEFGYKALHTTVEKMALTPKSAFSSLPLYWDVVKHFSSMDGERFKSKPDHVHRVFPYFQKFERPKIFDNVYDASLILRLTFDKLELYRQVVANWPGPMSVAIFGDDKDAANADVLPKRDNIAYHFVYKKSGSEEIPAQMLRTIAIKYATTSHIIIGDLNYRVSNQTHSTLKEMLKAKVSHIAVPSFVSTCVLMADLVDKDDLLKYQVLGKVKNNADIEGNIYKRWALTPYPFIAKWRSKHFYYIVMPTASHPVFQRKFNELDYEDIRYEEDFLVNKQVLMATCCFALKLPLAIDAISDPNYTIQC